MNGPAGLLEALDSLRAENDELERENEQLRARVAEVTRERDEWEERYEWLLGEAGGTASPSRDNRGDA